MSGIGWPTMPVTAGMQMATVQKKIIFSGQRRTGG
jgi:hypothetical protein